MISKLAFVSFCTRSPKSKYKIIEFVFFAWVRYVGSITAMLLIMMIHLCKEDSDLASPPSSWDSIQTWLRSCPWRRRCPLCLSLWWRLAAGSNTHEMVVGRNSRSPCPSRLSRPLLGFWHGRMGSWTHHCYREQLESGWTPVSTSSHSLLVSSLSSRGC